MATTPRADRPGDDVSSAGVEVIRSEEQLLVSTRVGVAGRAVLRKYVITETVTQTVQVRREEVRLEHLPDADGTADTAARTPFEEGVVVDVVLHREVPRIVMDVVATERVRLRTENVTSQVQVQEEVRGERVALDAAPELGADARLEAGGDRHAPATPTGGRP